MLDDATVLSNFGGITRLFPLPNLVLFPGVVQGLHIFEPRYRQMTADALAGDGLIALVMLRPDWEEDYDARPAVEAVGCLGRITAHELLPDGRYNLRLRGLARARIVEEVATDRLYRSARVELLPETAPDLDESRRLRRELAEVVVPGYAYDDAARRQLQELFDGEMPLGRLCDVLSYALPLPRDFKQSMLSEPDAGRRAAAVAEAVRIASAGRRFPPDFSSN